MTTLLSSLNNDDYNNFLHKDKPLKLGEYEINLDMCHRMRVVTPKGNIVPEALLTHIYDRDHGACTILNQRGETIEVFIAWSGLQQMDLNLLDKTRLPIEKLISFRPVIEAVFSLREERGTRELGHELKCERVEGVPPHVSILNTGSLYIQDDGHALEVKIQDLIPTCLEVFGSVGPLGDCTCGVCRDAPGLYLRIRISGSDTNGKALYREAKISLVEIFRTLLKAENQSYISEDKLRKIIAELSDIAAEAEVAITDMPASCGGSNPLEDFEALLRDALEYVPGTSIRDCPDKETLQQLIVKAARRVLESKEK